jgi:hypothetical protein
VSRVPPVGQRDRGSERTLSLRLDPFGWEALEQESNRLGVSQEELVGFAVMYYLADADSGRITRRPPRGSNPSPE